MSTRWARFARGWLAAIFSTLVAAVSHTLAGGTAPAAVSIAVALAFAGITCIALTGKRLSTVRLGASVILSQVAFHTLFGTIGSPSAIATSGGTSTHTHGADLTLLVGDTGQMHHTDGWMWLGHAIAAVATIVALRYGEAAFWQLRQIAVLFARNVVPTVPVVSALPRVVRAPLAAAQHLEARTCDFIRSSLGLRGPPASSFS